MNSENNKYSVSVIIPSYNMADLLPRAVASAAEQLLPPAEIIVVDDGSSDNTVEILETLKQKHPSLRYTSQENKGNAGAKNTGIQIANGNWLAFLDADDAWLPNRLSSQVELLKENAELKWVAGGYVQVRYRDGSPVVVAQPRISEAVKRTGSGVYNALDLISGKTSVWIGAVTACKESIKSLDCFCEDLLGCDDSDLWIRMAIAHEKIGFVVEPVSRYTVAQQNSLTGQAARTISPSQFTHYERLTRLINETKNETQRNQIKSILQGKTEGSLTSLLRTRSFGQAKLFIEELKRRKLPVPSWRPTKSSWSAWSSRDVQLLAPDFAYFIMLLFGNFWQPESLAQQSLKLFE